jgi:hypothetical protein
MDEDLDIDINGDDLIQPSKPVFGPKPQQILELEERLDITLYEEKFISLDEFDDFVEESMFSRDSLGEIISLKLSLQELILKTSTNSISWPSFR